MLNPQQAEGIPGGIDPALRVELAHSTAEAVVHRTRSAAPDAELVSRVISLVDDQGLEVVAALWADSPPASLPGALWRLYALRDWVRKDPRGVAERYQLGAGAAEVHDAVAGVASPPEPQEVVRVVDEVLSGVFAGDLAVALERGAAFCQVLATGGAYDADRVEAHDSDLAGRITRGSAALSRTSAELVRCAALWRQDALD